MQQLKSVRETLRRFLEDGYLVTSDGFFLSERHFEEKMPGFDEPARVLFYYEFFGGDFWEAFSDLDGYEPLAIVAPASIEDVPQAYRRGDARCYLVWRCNL